ncbi:MAG TPA: amino acid--tRNA ligase-related protein, partial [Polyangiaceae bacterium]|nr:amino acid--tRNA ligase-related protein [Polyangiaceae bacterium]
MESPSSPSDLVRHRPGERVRVAGRVSAVNADGCELADAFTSVRLALNEATATLGDLLVVEGTFDGRTVGEAVVVERTACPEPRGDGDLARFAWHGVGRNLQARARALSAVRDYFAREQFLEVETPLRVPAPGVDLHLDAIAAHGGYLITSPELHMKRLLAAGFPRVFQVARASRLDELGQLHEPEFTMLEWYRAFAGLSEMLSDTEQLLRAVAERVSGEARLLGPTGQRYELALPFQRITVREAFREYAGIADAVDLAQTDEARYFEL